MIDLHSRPTITSNKSNRSEGCPAAVDVWNTPADMRWRVWDDGPNCSGGCHVRGCSPHGKALVPCCVRRVKVRFPIDCNLLAFGCAKLRPGSC